MIASLLMYDRPETRGPYEELWDGIRAAFDGDLPEKLTQDGDLWEHWMSPELALAQTCGLPLRARLKDHVTLVGTPDYRVEGCPPGYYNSVAVMRLGDVRQGDPRHLRLAYNDPLSQSGWAAAVEHAGGPDFAGYLRTGSHAASAVAVADGAADIAYLDAVTWRTMARWDDVASGLRVVARTDPTPGLPIITAHAEWAEDLATAIARAIDGLSLDAREATGLHDLVRIPLEAYLSRALPPKPPI